MSDLNSPHDPNPLSYASNAQDNRSPAPPFAKWFFMGLGIGVLISICVYGIPLAIHANGTDVSGAIVIGGLVLLGAKLITGVVFLCLRNRRALGAGLLVSLTLGFLIFFGTCAATLKFN